MWDYIGIDWGQKNIGIAFGDSSSGLAIPWSNVISNDVNTIENLKDILFAKPTIKYIALGWPTNFQLQETIVSDKIKLFQKELITAFPTLSITLVNERQSSQNAMKKIGMIGFGKKKQATKHLLNKKNITNFDSLAAVEIVQRLIDTHQHITIPRQ
jgi:RNase H-fold protein (predicted Holliday junction resolvase)